MKFSMALICLFLGIMMAENAAAQKKDEVELGQFMDDSLSLRFYSFDSVEAYIPDIRKSIYPIEIRFYNSPGLYKTFTVTILQYNNGRWKLSKRLIDIPNHTTDDIKVSYRYGNDSLFNYLVANNIFGLQYFNTTNTFYNVKTNELEHLSGPDSEDPSGYSIEFKVGNRYRRYQFNNADLFYNKYRKNYESENYTNIVKVMQSLK